MTAQDIATLIGVSGSVIVSIIAAVKGQSTADTVRVNAVRADNQVADLHSRIDDVHNAVSENLNMAIQQLGASTPAPVPVPQVAYSTSQGVLPMSTGVNTALGTNATGGNNGP